MAESRASFVRPPASSGRPLGGLLKDIYGAKLGLLADMAKSPEKELGLLKQALGGNRQASDEWMRQAMQSPFMGFGVGNIKAFHGSPHAFGKFSTKHIGKGEGAQAYGHGLYFAENPKVAKSYKDSLRWKGTNWDDPESVAGFWLHHQGGNAKAAADLLRGSVGKQSTAKSNDAVRRAIEILESGGKGKTAQNPGRLYEVNIKPEPEDFLDWDKPLSQQSEKVRKAIESVDNEMFGRWRESGAWPHVKGQILYRELAEGHTRGAVARGADVTASTALRKAGIRGIKYKDAGSRGKGEGTSNFVVFDDADVEIKGLLD